jgi:hypothetical protein
MTKIINGNRYDEVVESKETVRLTIYYADGSKQAIRHMTSFAAAEEFVAEHGKFNSILRHTIKPSVKTSKNLIQKTFGMPCGNAAM